MRYSVNRADTYAADFETVTAQTEYFKKHQDTKVLLACSVDLATETPFICASINDWWDFHVKKQKNQVIYFHNLSYDASFILPFLIQQGYKPTMNTRLKECTNKTFSFFANGSRIFEICCFFRTKHKRYFIRINCSYRLLALGIDGIGKSVGIKKHQDGEDASFYDIEPQDTIDAYNPRFVEYIQNDCKIARRGLLLFEKGLMELKAVKLDTLLRSENGDKPRDMLNNLTITQTTKKLMKMYEFQFRRKHKIKARMLTNTTRANELASAFIAGGLTQFNPKYLGEYQDMHNCIYLDINSAYPFAMTQLLPYGEPLDEPPLGEYIAAHYIDVKKATIKQGFENFAVLKNPKRLKKSKNNDDADKRYCRFLKNFTMHEFDCTGKALQRVYDFKVRNIKTVYFRAAPFLREYANELYEKRTLYKKAGDPLQLSMKILMNAGYGGLLMKSDYPDWLVVDNDTAQDIYNQITTSDNELFEYGGRFYKFRYESAAHESPHYKVICAVRMDKKNKEGGFNRGAGAYIPAFVRSMIVNRVVDEGVQHFVYSDTDSIILNNLTNERLNELKNVNNSTLGNFKVEDELTQFSTYGAKRLSYINKAGKIEHRFAGVSEQASSYSQARNMIDFEGEEIVIKDAVFVRTRCPSGIVLVKRDKLFKKGNI